MLKFNLIEGCGCPFITIEWPVDFQVEYSYNYESNIHLFDPDFSKKHQNQLPLRTISQRKLSNLWWVNPSECSWSTVKIYSPRPLRRRNNNHSVCPCRFRARASTTMRIWLSGTSGPRRSKIGRVGSMRPSSEDPSSDLNSVWTRSSPISWNTASPKRIRRRRHPTPPPATMAALREATPRAPMATDPPRRGPGKTLILCQKPLPSLGDHLLDRLGAGGSAEKPRSTVTKMESWGWMKAWNFGGEEKIYKFRNGGFLAQVSWRWTVQELTFVSFNSALLWQSIWDEGAHCSIS